MAQTGNLPLHKRFNEIEMKKDIVHRYLNITKALPRQLKYLKESRDFAAIVKNMRKKGWKDWHILLGTYNAVLNLKHKDAGASDWYPRTDEEKKKMMKFKEEEDFQPYPVSEFTEEKFVQYFHFTLLSVCKTMGFVFRRQDVRIDKIEKFLRQRMLFFELDVDHDKYFPLADDGVGTA